MSARPVATEIARTSNSTLLHVVCKLGPRDRPYPERHVGWCVAFVRRGTFTYRAHDAPRGRDLRASWLLLGRHGHEFECGHLTCAGDECTVIDISEALIEDVRAAVRLRGGKPFPDSVMPPVPRVGALVLKAERAASNRSAIDADALALDVVEAVLGAFGASSPVSRDPSSRDRDRVQAALDVIDAAPGESWPLGKLAALVDASPFHFARAFRAIVGATPHRYLIASRLHRAAWLLLETKHRVTDIAYEVGFGDLSNFIHTFRHAVAQTPRDYRASR